MHDFSTSVKHVLSIATGSLGDDFQMWFIMNTRSGISTLSAAHPYCRHQLSDVTSAQAKSQGARSRPTPRRAWLR